MYTFGVAAICWVIWKAINSICFEKKSLKSPFDIVFSACALMRYWACLYPDNSQETIKVGVDLMMQTAIKAEGGGKNVKALKDAGGSQ
jgi:hypothetical protein